MDHESHGHCQIGRQKNDGASPVYPGTMVGLHFGLNYILKTSTATLGLHNQFVRRRQCLQEPLNVTSKLRIVAKLGADNSLDGCDLVLQSVCKFLHRKLT